VVEWWTFSSFCLFVVTTSGRQGQPDSAMPAMLQMWLAKWRNVFPIAFLSGAPINGEDWRGFVISQKIDRFRFAAILL
jgi:hypothetical protein